MQTRFTGFNAAGIQPVCEAAVSIFIVAGFCVSAGWRKCLFEPISASAARVSDGPQRPLAVYVFYELRIIDRIVQWKRGHGRKNQPVDVQAQVDSRLKPAQQARKVRPPTALAFRNKLSGT